MMSEYRLDEWVSQEISTEWRGIIAQIWQVKKLSNYFLMFFFKFWTEDYSFLIIVFFFLFITIVLLLLLIIILR